MFCTHIFQVVIRPWS